LEDGGSPLNQNAEAFCARKIAKSIDKIQPELKIIALSTLKRLDKEISRGMQNGHITVYEVSKLKKVCETGSAVELIQCGTGGESRQQTQNIFALFGILKREAHTHAKAGVGV
jgi:hypothetical protein